MKRLALAAITIAALCVAVHFGFWALAAYYGHSLRKELRDAKPIYHSQLQPGLEFFKDLDEVRFVCDRAFDGSVEITVRKPYLLKGKPPELFCVQRFPGEGPDGKPRIEEKTKIVSEEVFRELQDFVLRQDMIDRSLPGSPVSTDGSMWLLEGTKGDFVISHRRLNPIYLKDKTCVAIGLRFFELAGIEIPECKLY